MDFYFNMFAISLFAAAAAVFFWRSRSQQPRFLPYAVVIVGGFVAALAGQHGAVYPSVGIFIAASVLIVHLASEPFGDTFSDQA